MKRPVKKIIYERVFPTPVQTLGEGMNTTRATVAASLLQYTSNNSWFASSNHSHGAVHGTNISATSASNGLSLSVQAPGVAEEHNFVSIYGNTSNASTVSGSSILLSAGTNITLAISDGSIKIEGGAGAGASLYAGNYISLSASSISTTVSVVGLQATSATSAITANALNTSVSGSFQLTADNSLSLGTGYTTHTHQYQSTGNYLTTAAASDHTHSQYQSTGNYLTTAMQSDYTSVLQYTSNTSAITSNALNTNQSSLFQHTSATSNITSNAANTSHTHSQYQSTGAYLTTAAASGHSHGDISLALTNMNGTTSSASSGLTLSLSANAGGGGIAASIGGNSTSGGGGYSNITSGTLHLRGGNNITLSQDGASVTISGANIGGAQTGISGIGVSDTTYSSGTVIISGANNITVSSSVNGASQYVRLSVGNYLTTAMASESTSVFQYTSNTSAITSNALNTNQSSLFQHTSATSAITANALNTNQSSLFQHTSATSAITANAMNTSERGNYFYTSNNTFLTTAALSNHSHSLNEVTSVGGDVNVAFGQYGINFQFPVSVSTNATRGGAFEVDAQGAFAGDLVHIHQHLGNPAASVDLLHVEADNSAVTGIHAELSNNTNQLPIYVHGASQGISISLESQGVPLKLNQSASNSVQWLNANYLQGKVSSEFQSTGNYLTTAMASENTSLFQYTSATSAITSNALNTNQSSLFQHTSATSAITSAAFPSVDTTKFAGTGTSATNASITLNSNGLAVSVQAPGAAEEYNYVNLYGNTSNSSTASGSSILLSAGNNITLAASGGSIKIEGGGGGGVAIGASNTTYTSGTVVFRGTNVTVSTSAGQYVDLLGPSPQSLAFEDSNGITFGASVTSNSTTITASYNSTQFAVVNHTHSDLYINTSVSGSFQYTSNTSAITASALNTNQSSLFQHTSATSAITNSAMNTSERGNYFYTSNNTFLTTAALSNHTHSDLYIALSNSTYYQSSNLSSVFQTTGAYLTTARASNDAVGLNTSVTNMSATINSSGITLSGSAVEQAYYLSGANTAGTTSFSAGSALTLSGGNNITLSGNSNNQIVISAGAGGGGVAVKGSGTYVGTSGTIEFSNANGVTFGLSADNVMTASVNAGGGGVAVIASDATYTSGSVSFRGTNITISTSAGGQFIDLIAGAGGGIALAGSAASTVTSGTVQFSNLNGLSFGLNGSTMTASAAFAGTTTATTGNIAITASTDGIQINAGNLAGTGTAVTGNASITLNTTGLSFNGSGLAGTATGATNMSITANSGGISVNHPIGSGASTATTTGTAILLSHDTYGVKIHYPNFIGTAVGSTNCSVTANTAGVSVNVPAATGTVYFVNSNGASWGSSTGASVTSYWVVTA